MKKMLICILLLTTAMNISAQTLVIYSYDSAGNRTARAVTLKLYESLQTSDDLRTTTALGDLITEKGIVIYPNPTKETLSVEIKGNPDKMPVEIRLTDLSGRTIISKKASNGYQTFDLSRQAAGIYLLQIRINGESTVRKIIKK